MITSEEVSKYGMIRYKLSEAARKRNLSLRAVAQLANLNSPLILYRAVSGKTQPSFWQIARICAVLKCEVSELIEYVPAENLVTPDNAGDLVGVVDDGLPASPVPDLGNPAG